MKSDAAIGKIDAAAPNVAAKAAHLPGGLLSD